MFLLFNSVDLEVIASLNKLAIMLGLFLNTPQPKAPNITQLGDFSIIKSIILFILSSIVELICLSDMKNILAYFAYTAGDVIKEMKAGLSSSRRYLL